MKKYGEIKYSLRRYDYLEGNFTQIINDVFKLTTGNEFKVYSYLCCNYNKALGCSFPSLNLIAKNTNMSKATVQKCINKLEKLGLIKIGKFENKIDKYINNIYIIFIPIIIKNEIEKDTESKIYTFTFEHEDDE